MLYVLDRIEEGTAIFISDGEEILSCPTDEYAEYREGDVFRTEGGRLIYDEAETDRRRAEIRERIRRLAKRKHNNN